MRTLSLLGLGMMTSTLVACVAEVPGEPGDSDTGDGGANIMSEAALSSNEVNAFNYFISQGLTPVQSAGIVGNLMQESDVSPTVKEYGGGPGRGIAQWSVGGRWDTSSHDNVAWYAAQNGGSQLSLNTQLEFIWYELTNVGYGYSQLEAATDVTTATLVFMKDYEILRDLRVGDARRLRQAGARELQPGQRRRRRRWRRWRRGQRRRRGVLLGDARQGHAGERVRPEQVRQRLVPVRQRRVGGPLDRPGRLRRHVSAVIDSRRDFAALDPRC